MNKAIGEDRTSPEHRAWANQLYAIYARGREARLTAAIVGESGLDDADRRALNFADRFETAFVGQGTVRRSIGDTISAGWDLLTPFPPEELGRLGDAAALRRPGPERVK
jgi:V/A-type H+-transporting ATPase subunit B